VCNAGKEGGKREGERERRGGVVCAMQRTRDTHVYTCELRQHFFLERLKAREGERARATARVTESARGCMCERAQRARERERGREGRREGEGGRERGREGGREGGRERGGEREEGWGTCAIRLGFRV